MKFKNLILILPIIVASCSMALEGDSDTSNTSKVRIENVKKDVSHPNAGYVSGMVRNLSNSSIKGAVKIKFLNSDGDIVHSSRAFVNDGDPLKPNQAGEFSYATDPKYFKDVVDFEIVFYER